MGSSGDLAGYIASRTWPARLLGAALSVLLVAGCSDRQHSEEPPPSIEQADIEYAPANADPALAAAHRMALTTRQELCAASSVLESQVAEFMQSPSRAGLGSAREAWRTAHQNWQHWRRLLLTAGLDESDTAHPMIDVEPILPGYLDSVPGYPISGLVYSEVPLDPQALAEEHLSTDLYYVVLGFHPLEFMLWGAPDEDGKPTRKATAFEPASHADADTVPAADRRRTLTQSMAGLLQLAVEEHCAPTVPLPDLSGLAMLFATEGKPPTAIGRRDLLVAWLDELAQTLARWRSQPSGEDNNGMPLWHSAFARTDFTELDAEWSWLMRHFWPEAGPDVSAAKRLGLSLRNLAEAEPAPPGLDDISATRDAAMALAQTLTGNASSASKKDLVQ
ncbi:imelysin family protein [Hydrocarboniclastica marina]|uniref:Imelysin-like domain-containing protein n=1 Tax=Hydrocarboniclastica marina TaxID=2259620 RepID=A0A4P7XDS7_9ALTE|nr:imelysin family protein [Hydrocarboniclastica marina]QCF25059.1 hypothetical protein soil367_03385 [Hydrocarboniclastica marina]